MSDNGNNQDDVETINLPFTFKFYGQEYDEISICSNGWIAMGETDMESFRNYELPGMGGPTAMIAVFWDDLTTQNGGDIFTKYIQPSGNESGRYVYVAKIFNENAICLFSTTLFSL